MLVISLAIRGEKAREGSMARKCGDNRWNAAWALGVQLKDERVF
jgi:hypothetical protein